MTLLFFSFPSFEAALNSEVKSEYHRTINSEGHRLNGHEQCQRIKLPLELTKQKDSKQQQQQQVAAAGKHS